MSSKPLPSTAPDLSIAAVLEHYGATVPHLRSSGWRPMRCPFTDGHSRGDRVLSASVSAGKNAFVCHACGVKGSAISLIMERERLDYVGALTFAQEVLGVGIGDVRRSASRSQPKRQPSRWREKLFS